MKQRVRKILLLMLVLCVACSDDMDKVEVSTGVDYIPDSRDYYYYDYYLNEIPLTIDTNLLHVVIPQETYEQLLQRRVLRGEQSIGHEDVIDSSFFKRDTLLNKDIYRYVGCIETVVGKNELLTTDSIIYRGCVYREGEIPSEEESNYTFFSNKVYVKLHEESDVDLLLQYADEYGAELYAADTDYLGDKFTWYYLFYTNSKCSLSVISMVNRMIESGDFSKVSTNVTPSWMTLL